MRWRFLFLPSMTIHLSLASWIMLHVKRRDCILRTCEHVVHFAYCEYETDFIRRYLSICFTQMVKISKVGLMTFYSSTSAASDLGVCLLPSALPTHSASMSSEHEVATTSPLPTWTLLQNAWVLLTNTFSLHNQPSIRVRHELHLVYGGDVHTQDVRIRIDSRETSKYTHLHICRCSSSNHHHTD